MKLTKHEKELLSQALDLARMDFEDNADSYFCMRDGEDEYNEKMLNPDISDEESEKLEMEFENKPTFFDELEDLIERLSDL